VDGLFFLKASVPKGLPASVKGIALDPVAMGFGCGGADAYCSTAYAGMWAALGGPQGQVIPNLKKKYSVTGRVAFVSFSAGHGFMNPLLSHETPDAVILVDSTFGGGKSGYVKAAQVAASGGPLLVSATSDKHSTDALSNGDYAWREFVLKPAGLLDMPAGTVRPPMPVPSEGVFSQNNLYYYRYTHAELPHTSMGKILNPLIQAYLLPYWAGTLVAGGLKSIPLWWYVVGGALAFGGLYLLSRGMVTLPKKKEEEDG
jgi:hypothetical protein